MDKIELIINDEAIINDRGYNILNKGLNRERFDLNPVTLYMHDMNKVIGRCEELRTEGTKLIGSFVFDEEDELARDVARKLEQGFLRGCSAGLYIESMSFGIDHDTVDKWELFEVSVVSIPANRGAVKLYAADGDAINNEDEFYETLKIKNDMKEPENKIMLSIDALKCLNRQEAPSVEELSAHIVELHTRCEQLESTIESNRTTQRDELIAKAVEEGRIDKADAELYASLYDQNAEMCQKVLAKQSPRQSLTAMLHAGSSDRFKGDWDELDRKGLLATLKAENPDLYAEKFNAKFNN